MRIKNLLNKKYIQWRLAQVNCKWLEETRKFKDRFSTSQVALGGAFHETNLGDITLRKPFEKALRSRNIKFSIQNIYNFKTYKKRDVIIITGGATGVADNINTLYQYYGNNPENVIMCGMDFSDVSKFSSEKKEFLKQCSYISLRAKDQYEKLNNLGFKNISFSYDNAFGLPQFDSGDKREKTIGFNMLNLFMMWNGKEFTPGTPLLNQYKRNNPGIEETILKIGPEYINLFNEMVNHFVAKGYKVEHIPFTPEDDFFAKTTIKNRAVKFVKYSKNTENVIYRISQYKYFYSTRFHATIFGFLSGTPTIPFLYSKKCNDLMKDMELDYSDLIWREDVVNSFEESRSKFIEHQGIVISKEKLDYYRKIKNDEIQGILKTNLL